MIVRSLVMDYNNNRGGIVMENRIKNYSIILIAFMSLSIVIGCKSKNIDTRKTTQKAGISTTKSISKTSVRTSDGMMSSTK